MRRPTRPHTALLLCLLVLSPWASASPEDDQAALETLLEQFLAGTDQRAVHASFWADDLIYTGSAGTRRGKAAILAGFDTPAVDTAATEDTAETPPLRYGAEDITTRILGDVAVVTFRLTADRGQQRDSEYFNTGVFRRHGDSWQAFTWQATRIPNP